LAQLTGTLVSESIVAYRVHIGALPDADRHLLDIGPSYVVVAAIAVAVLYGPWLGRRALALADLAVLVFAGHIFAGLSQLQVSAAGHLTALLTGAALGGVLTWRRRGRRRHAQPGAEGPANGNGDPGEMPAGQARPDPALGTSPASSRIGQPPRPAPGG
jgi:hypothetical protein